MNLQPQYFGKKELVQKMLQGFGLRKSINHHGHECYRVYDANMNCVGMLFNPCKKLLAVTTVKACDRKTGMRTLNLLLVKQLHGNSSIKKAYTRSKKKKQQACKPCSMPSRKLITPQKIHTCKAI